MKKVDYNLTNLTNAQLIVMHEVFGEVRQRNIPMKGKVLYAIQRNEKKLHHLFMQLQFRRQEIFRTHADIDSETSEFKIREDEREQLEQEIQAFANEINAVSVYKAPMSLLNDADIEPELYGKLTYTGMFEDDMDDTVVGTQESSPEPELLLG